MTTARKAAIAKNGNGRVARRGRKPAVAAVSAAVALSTSAEERHELFAQEYLVDLNATAAYIRVFGAAVDRAGAAVNAHALLRNPKIARRIGELKTERLKRLHLEQDRPVRVLLNVMEADIADIFTPEGQLRGILDIPEDTRRAIAGMKVRRVESQKNDLLGIDETIIEVKFWPKVQAAEAMARITGLTGDTKAAPSTIVERQVILIFGKEIEV